MNESKLDAIRIKNITKDYGENRGNFGINLSIKEGETLGLIGENGAGKTTLIRQMMGFIKPDEGKILIYGMDAYEDSSFTKPYIGYVPGEINFPDVPSGSEFLHGYGESLGMRESDFAYADSVISRMQLDVRAYPKRMSKGMKQKTAIVAAFMRKPPILLLDEPSIGLDPLMREELLELILEQKKRGATILMSSNAIEELERVCDRVALISKGKILDEANVGDIKNRPVRDYKIEFVKKEDYEAFKGKGYRILRDQAKYNQLTLRVNKDDIPKLLKNLKGNELKFFSEVPYNLATHFEENRLRRIEKEKAAAEANLD